MDQCQRYRLRQLHQSRQHCRLEHQDHLGLCHHRRRARYRRPQHHRLQMSHLGHRRRLMRDRRYRLHQLYMLLLFHRTRCCMLLRRHRLLLDQCLLQMDHQHRLRHRHSQQSR